MTPTFSRPLAFAAVAVLLALAQPAFGDDQPAGSEAPPELDALLERLAQKAEQYYRYALGFTCEESVIRTYYNAEEGKFRRRDREVYDYLFERSEVSGRLGEVRDLIEENGKQVRRSNRELDLDIPPSYAWSQIFARENRGKFQYRLAGRVLRGYRLLVQIDFVGGGAEPGKGDIAGWTGRASVDSGTLNLYQIEAEPSGQSARVEAERLKYQRAFQIMGVPLAQRPKTRTLSVVFGLDNEGLTYPTETMMLKSVYVRTSEQGLEQKVQLRYRSYRFFRVGTQVEEVRDKSVVDPNAPRPAADANQPGQPPPVTPPPADPNQPRRPRS